MLTRVQKPQETEQFRLPFAHTTSWSDFKTEYPAIEREMDGTDISATLDFYYSKNPLTNVYEFVGEDAENDIADLIGISFNVISTGEELDCQKERKLAGENMQELMDYLEASVTNTVTDDVTTEQPITDKQARKNEKKARRNQRLSERNI